MRWGIQKPFARKYAGRTQATWVDGGNNSKHFMLRWLGVNNACVGETVAPFWCGKGGKVGVGGTFLIKSAFLINIIVCTSPKDTVWQENNVQISKGEPVVVIWTHKKSSSDVKNNILCRQAGRQTYTNETKGPREMLAGYAFFDLVLFRYAI